MQFITTELTFVFHAGVKELGERYATTCMSLHMTQTLNTHLSDT